MTQIKQVEPVITIRSLSLKLKKKEEMVILNIFLFIPILFNFISKTT